MLLKECYHHLTSSASKILHSSSSETPGVTWHFLLSLFWETWGTARKREQGGGFWPRAQTPGPQVLRKIIRKYSDTLNIKRALVLIIVMMILMVATNKAFSAKETHQQANQTLSSSKDPVCSLSYSLSPSDWGGDWGQG